METQSTTPFGRRPYTLAMAASEAIAKGCPAGIAVHKWEVFRAVCEGRVALGVSERALSVLNALLTFHPETVLTGDANLVVFPSNQQLALRAHGMAPSTLRRHLAVLVDTGLVIRRDSPNGKRYQRKSRGGEATEAFGFELKPFVARAGEFEMHARAVREERHAVARLREQITIARRDVVKMIAVGLEEDVPGPWETVREVYAAIMARLPRLANSAILGPIAEELALLRMEAVNLLESHINPRKTTTNESVNEQHKQNSKPEPSIESETAFREEHGQSITPKNRDGGPPKRSFPPAMVIDACPDIIDYARHGVDNWPDLFLATDVARGALGISPSAYEDARSAMGPCDCAIVVASILQKGASINNAGAYLRGLTTKAREGAFSPGPMLMALLRAKHREQLGARECSIMATKRMSHDIHRDMS